MHPFRFSSRVILPLLALALLLGLSAIHAASPIQAEEPGLTRAPEASASTPTTDGESGPVIGRESGTIEPVLLLLNDFDALFQQTPDSGSEDGSSCEKCKLGFCELVDAGIQDCRTEADCDFGICEFWCVNRDLSSCPS